MEIVLVLVGVILSFVGVLAWLFYSARKHAKLSAVVQAIPVAEAIVARDDESIVVLAEALENEGSATEIQRLQEEVRQTREKAVLQVRDAIDVINKLKEENELLCADMKKLQSSAPVRASVDIRGEAMDALKEDRESLREGRAKLEAYIEELEESVRVEAQKNSFLQYELTKSRAQAIGVERICDNARRQFEGMVRETRVAEQDKAVLRKQAGILEQGLTDFKRLNLELLKREKLTQFELESNRTQLKDLENIYQVFRARLENAGVDVNASGIKS